MYSPWFEFWSGCSFLPPRDGFSTFQGIKTETTKHDYQLGQMTEYNSLTYKNEEDTSIFIST